MEDNIKVSRDLLIIATRPVPLIDFRSLVLPTPQSHAEVSDVTSVDPEFTGYFLRLNTISFVR